MRLAFMIALLSLLATTAFAEQDVGVTAAVNQSANAVRNGTVRTISLGDHVIFNQRIKTDAGGLVQILLADGTTFMVGPNSDLAIDSFVYDPDAGTAKVTATFTKGVLRFIGSTTSKTEDGVTVKTPVGTVGIRGAMVDLVLTPPPGTPQHIDMLFGTEVTLERCETRHDRVYADGYSLVLGPDCQIKVQKTPPGWGTQIQAALAGRPGTSGGAPKSPTNADVAKVAEDNSGNGPGPNTPGVPPLTDEEEDQLLVAVAAYDELHDLILNTPQGPQGPVVRTQQGFASGLFGAVLNFGGVVPLDTAVDEASGLPATTEVGFNADGDALEISLGLGSPACYGCSSAVDYDGGRSGGSGVVHLTREVPDGPDPDSDPDEEPYDSLFTASGWLHNASEVTLPSATYCACTFISWGTWGTAPAAFITDGGTGTIDFDGLWVTGDITTESQLQVAAADDIGMIATYEGHATGVVSNISGTERYLATGSFEMLWSFASRDGSFVLPDFDGRLIGGYIDSWPEDSFVDNRTGFSGSMNDPNHNDLQGRVQGAFVNDGSTPMAGVIGDFDFYDPDNDWTATGVFMGERGPDTIPH
jgi:hypothetical protein